MKVKKLKKKKKERMWVELIDRKNQIAPHSYSQTPFSSGHKPQKQDGTATFVSLHH